MCLNLGDDRRDRHVSIRAAASSGRRIPLARLQYGLPPLSPRRPSRVPPRCGADAASCSAIYVASCAWRLKK